MNQTKTLFFRSETISQTVLFALLLSTAIFAPLVKQQAITGTIVNAALFLSVAWLGLRGAVLLALVPSIFSLSLGFLPLVLAPMIPFIILGNIILVSAFGLLKKKNYWIAVVSAAFLKFIFILISSQIIFNLLLKNAAASKIIIMFSWPQFFTALGGGLMAYVFLRFKK